MCTRLQATAPGLDWTQLPKVSSISLDLGPSSKMALNEVPKDLSESFQCFGRAPYNP